MAELNNEINTYVKIKFKIDKIGFKYDRIHWCPFANYVVAVYL